MAVSHPRDSSSWADKRTLQRQSGQLTSERRSRRGIIDRSQPPLWPGRTGEHHEDPPPYQSPPHFSGHFYYTTESESVVPTSNTIEGGLMKIKTPYRIPYLANGRVGWCWLQASAIFVILHVLPLRNLSAHWQNALFRQERGDDCLLKINISR